MASARVDYDAIADFYDDTPYRGKDPDAELLAFVAGRGASPELAVLDVACGTGNQLVADHAALSGARLVGIDRSAGMLAQAHRKEAGIAWVRADGAVLPFAAGRFDFVTCQMAFHHFADKTGHLDEVFRVLKPGGRFVMTNLSPHDSPDWLYYRYFPEALTRDLDDFWAPDMITAEMLRLGFDRVAIERRHVRFRQDMRHWDDEVRRRGTCSQLLAIPDAAYEAGLQRLSADLTAAGGPLLRDNHLCLVTIRGDKPPPLRS